MYQNNRFIKIYKKQHWQKTPECEPRTVTGLGITNFFSAKLFSALYRPLPIIKLTPHRFYLFILFLLYCICYPIQNLQISIYAYLFVNNCKFACVCFNQCGISYATFLHPFFVAWLYIHIFHILCRCLAFFAH